MLLWRQLFLSFFSPQHWFLPEWIREKDMSMFRHCGTEKQRPAAIEPSRSRRVDLPALRALMVIESIQHPSSRQRKALSSERNPNRWIFSTKWTYETASSVFHEEHFPISRCRFREEDRRESICWQLLDVHKRGVCWCEELINSRSWASICRLSFTRYGRICRHLFWHPTGENETIALSLESTDKSWLAS